MARRYKPVMTGAKLAFLGELERIGVGEPCGRGAARHAMLCLGWIDTAWELADGRRMTRRVFEALYPGAPGATTWSLWRDCRLLGVCTTFEGRMVLRQARVAAG